MRAAYLIIAVVMLFMFIFVANEVDLGIASPLLSVGFFGVFLYCLFLFAVDWREARRKPDEQAEYKVQLKKIMRTNTRDQGYRPRKRPRREY